MDVSLESTSCFPITARSGFAGVWSYTILLDSTAGPRTPVAGFRTAMTDVNQSIDILVEA